LNVPVRRRVVRQEFDEFVTTAGPDLLRTAYLIVWDLPGAEDLVQECLFRVARRWPRVRSMEHRMAYARRILVNLALGDARSRSRRRAELDPWSSDALSARSDDAAARAFGTVEVTSDLLRAVAELPTRQRATLVLRYFQDLSEAEVAKILGCSVGTVKSTTSRALERLRRNVLVARMRDGPLHLETIFDMNGTTRDERGVTK
jgi:RNA polymerase sigma-70 factor (sigma-E family)